MTVHFVMGRRIAQNNRLGACINLEYNDDDSVRTSNEGLVYKKFFETLSGDFITEDIKHEFEIVIKISDVKRMKQTVNVDYNRLTTDSIPLWEINSCMDIYRAIKREVREKHDQYLAEEERKRELRQQRNCDDTRPTNSDESH